MNDSLNLKEIYEWFHDLSKRTHMVCESIEKSGEEVSIITYN